MRKMKYTNEELLDILKTEFSKTGIIPSSVTKRRIHKNVFQHRFGTWNEVLVRAGLPAKKAANATIIKKCEQCEEEFKTKKYKEANFCSVKCSNKSRRTKNWKDTERKPRNIWLNEIKQRWLTIPFNNLGWDTKRKRVIHEQNGKCNKCGTSEWMKEKLSLEVDHINGDNTDHRRENLEGLCPNCHSLTETYKGKNRSDTKITDDELLLAIKETSSIRQALILVGMSPRGANYRRIKKLLNV